MTEAWTIKDAAKEICKVCYIDTLVTISFDTIECCLILDSVSGIPSKKECEWLIMGKECEEGSLVPIKLAHRFKSLHAYLNQELT